MSSVRGRGRNRGRRVRKTCSSCRVFIPNGENLCSNCSVITDGPIQINPAIPAEEIHTEPIASIPTPIPLCSLCQNNFTGNGSLCDFCSPITLNDVTSLECQKCRRIPANTLHSAALHDIKSVAFGCVLTGSPQDTVYLCDECLRYTSQGNQSSWFNVWPSVILDFLRGKFDGAFTGKPFHKLLPATILQQYQHLFPNTMLNSDSIFEDLTPKLAEFEELKREFQIENIMKAHNKYCFPEIRCPFGCTEFVGESGILSLDYFLQSMDKNFKFYKTNWKRKLRCVRPDWLEESVHNGMFKMKPHVVLDQKQGLCLATCRFHNGGSNKFFVHPPKNPIGRMPSKFSDRLGPATITYNCFKPTKPNYSTHTYSMGIAKGNFSGISSTTIGTKRKWDIAFEKEDVCKESLCCNYRKDIKPFLQKLVVEGELSQDLMDSICDKDPMPPSADVIKSLESSTSVPFQQSFALKKIQETGIDVNYFPIFAQPFNNRYGCHPPDMNLGKNLPHHLWCLGTMFCLSSKFYTSLLSSTFPTDKVFKDFFSVLFTNNGVQPGKKTKEEIKACINYFPSTSNNLLQSFIAIIECISFLKIIFVDSREDVESKLIAETSPVVTITTRTRSGTHFSFLPDCVVIPNHEQKYELRSVTIMEGQTIKTLVRHGLQYDRWWMYNNSCNYAIEIKDTDASLMARFHSNWICCHYEVIDSENLFHEKMLYLEYLGGQGRFVCEIHRMPLTISNKKSSCICSLVTNCARKAAWQCPSDDCLSGVCRKHFKENIENENRILVNSTPRGNVTMNEEVEENAIPDTTFDNETNLELSDVESEVEEFEFVNYTTDPGGIENSETYEATDSGDVPLVMDSKDETIPTHILLNSDCHVLQRHRFRNDRSTKTSRFLQNIVASTPATSVPLLYPDAALFPTLYFHEQEDHTKTGALPASLYNDQQSKRFNFAPIDDHKRTALLNPNLIQSTDIRSIQTAFDTVFNKQLSLTDTRIVLNRGFQEVHSMKNKSIASENTRLQFDKADSRVRVNELASLLSDEDATFFLTLTCNQKDHFGVAPIFDALEKCFDRKCKEKWDKAVQAEIVLLTRAWYRSAEALMEWIEKSPEKPLGTVTKLWYRYEFQSTKGNLPHIHAVIWTIESKEEMKFKISCSGASALFELNKLCEESNLVKKNEIQEVWNTLMQVQTHSCEKASYRCHKVVKENGSTVCRVPRYPFSTQYTWRKVPSCHSDEALEKLFQLGLAEPSQHHDNTYQVDNLLQGGKFEYPASSEEHLSPFNTLLFIVSKSSQNLQLCDQYLSARYIAKYAAGVEERANAKVHPVNFREIKVESHGMQNLKINGPNISLKLNEKKNLVQIIPLVETIWWLLGFDYVHSSVDFVHLSTHEKAERGALAKNKISVAPTEALPLHVTKSNTLPPLRQFTRSQILLLKDSLECEFSVCKMTLFGGRPPPLLIVDNPKLYFTWFVREKVKHPDRLLKADVTTSYWIDVFGNVVKLRKCYLQDFATFLQSQRRKGHVNLQRFDVDSSLVFLQNDMVGLKTIAARHVQCVTSTIIPSNPFKFLIHIALSFGHFETEVDVFNQASMLEVFQACQIIPIKQSYNDQDAHGIIKRYVLEELKYLPGASRSFDRHFINSFDLLCNLVTKNIVQNEALPQSLHKAISEKATVAYNEFHRQKRMQSIQGCLLHPALEELKPYNDNFLNATTSQPFIFSFTVPRAPGQSDESYEFQCTVFDKVKRELENYIHRNNGFVKHQLFMGRPGSGKTLLCTMLFMQAIAKGLNCSITCLSGERAQELGGEHIHKMFKFRVNKDVLPDLMASQSITSLLKDVTRFTDLERLDVLFIDEIGQVNSQLLSAMEIVLQNIRDNRLPMGGVLTIMTGDPKQLKPPDGSLIWLSPKMLTNYEFYYFQHYVRATPGLLRSILEQLDESEISEREACEIAAMIVSNCKIRSSWDDDLDTFCMRVFSTRAAEQQAVLEHTNKVRSNPESISVTMKADDEESSTGSSIWLPAITKNSSFIDRHCITPKNLLLYKGAVMRFTANLKHIQARQGQLCVILNVPCDSTTDLEVLIAPPGCRSPNSFDEDTLLQCGWRKATVCKVYSPVINNQATFLRRYFFPLKNYVASTIHKCLGDTFPEIITKISLTENNYKLWEKEQLLVLLSRVSKIDEITFVGEKQDIENTLATIIQKQSCWTIFINEFLTKISSSQNRYCSSTLDLSSTQFQPWNIVLPEDDVGFVYLLVSTKKQNVFYVGETVCMRKSLREHNSGYGSKETRPIERRPWAVFAFVTGFNTHNHTCNRLQRKELESIMHYKTASLGPNISASIVMQVFEENCNKFAVDNNLNMKVIQCGKAP